MQAHPECGACFTQVKFFGPEHADFPMQGNLFQAENMTQEEWLCELYFHRNHFCFIENIYWITDMISSSPFCMIVICGFEF